MKKAEAEKLAIEKAQAAKAEAAAKQAADKAAKDAAAKADADRLAAEKARADAQARQAAERAAADRAREAAAKQAADAANAAIASAQAEAKDKAMQAIKQKVIRSWMRSPDSANLRCTVRVKLASDGTVIDVFIEKSSGNEMFDTSAENAVTNASPLPVPTDRELFAREFKTFTFVFDPK